MDAVELPLPAAIVTKIMRSSGCGGGGGVTTVELLGSQSERETCSSFFHPEKDDNCNANGSTPAFWNKMSDEDLYRQAGQLSSLCNEEACMDHDMASVPEAKQSQRKSGKAARTNGSSSRRSRAAHMEASLNVAGAVDMKDLSKELGSYPGKCNIAEKMQTVKQKTSVSGKRSDKRNGKVPKSKCDSFSVKAGLSSFISAAGGNNILGAYGSKQDIYDFAKHVDELSLNELLDGSYKCPLSIKDKENKTEVPNGSILQSVRQACSILHLQKSAQTVNVAAVDGTYNHNASLPNSGTSGASRNNDNKGDAVDPSSCNKAEDSCSVYTDHASILKFPLLAPKDVLDRLALPPPKDLDIMLLDSMKPSSTSKVQSGGSLPTFPWSHISGGHFKANPDVVKSTPSKSTCQGRWVKMGNSTTSLGDTSSYLADFESLTFNQSLVPLGCQQRGLTGEEKSPLPSTTDTTFDWGVTHSGSQPVASKIPAGHSAGVLAAAQTLCDIAAQFRKQDQNGMVRWQKKSFPKSIRASKLKPDEKLEKALFAIPSSRTVGPSNLINYADNAKTNTQKKIRPPVNEKSHDLSNTIKGQYHWPIATPQSSRSSPSKSFKNASAEAKHHESTNPMKRSITAPPARLPNKPPKLRKLVPMEWKSRGDQKGNAKF